MDTTIKIVIMVVTLIPVGVVALMGIGGDSLFQYAAHIIRYWASRRRLHYQRVGAAHLLRTEQHGARPVSKGAQKGRSRRSGADIAN